MKAKRSEFKDLLAWQYHRDVIDPIISAMEEATKKEVWPMVKALPYKFSMDDATSDKVDQAFKNARGLFFKYALGVSPRINPMEIFTDVQKGILNTFADKMVRKSVKDSESLVENIGSVNVFAMDKAMNRLKDQWVSENVNLIESIPASQFSSLKTKVWSAINSGENVGDTHGNIAGKKGLMADLMESFNISQNKAKLIARDQTLKFMSNLQKEQFNHLGIEYYKWSDSNDKRVRTKHEEVDQLYFKMGEKPPVGSKGENLEPGEDFQCRCQRIPYMPAVRGEVTMEKTGDKYGSYKPVKIKQAA